MNWMKSNFAYITSFDARILSQVNNFLMKLKYFKKTKTKLARALLKHNRQMVA
jgi:hypothetical protein